MDRATEQEKLYVLDEDNASISFTLWKEIFDHIEALTEENDDLRKDLEPTYVALVGERDNLLAENKELKEKLEEEVRQNDKFLLHNTIIASEKISLEAKLADIEITREQKINHLIRIGEITQHGSKQVLSSYAEGYLDAFDELSDTIEKKEEMINLRDGIITQRGKHIQELEAKLSKLESGVSFNLDDIVNEEYLDELIGEALGFNPLNCAHLYKQYTVIIKSKE